MLVAIDGVVSLVRACHGIDVNPKLVIASDINGAGMETSIEQLSLAIFQKIDRKIIASGYNRGSDLPGDHVYIFCNINWCLLLPLIWCFCLVRHVPH